MWLCRCLGELLYVEMSSPRRCRKGRAGQQKQDENHLAKRTFVELAVKHPAKPSPNCQRRQSEQEHTDSVDGDDSDAAESHDNHEKACDARGLKDGSLLIARPAAHARPDDGHDTGEPGSASDHTVENAYSPVGNASRLLHLR